MKKSIYRIILMVAGVLHLLFFFVLPYASLSDAMGALSGLASGLGLGDLYPEKLTGFAAVKMMSYMPDEGMLLCIVFVPPVVMGLLIFLMNLLGKKRLSYIGSIVLSFFMLSFYGLATSLASFLSDAGYQLGACGPLCILLSIVSFVVAIIGCVKDPGTAAQGANAGSVGKSVKPGKKDGTITGLSGAYAGAVIPVKGGDTVTIGRDPSVCSIVTKGEKVSRKHCTVTFSGDNGMYTVTDYSSNGTFDGAGNQLTRAAATPMAAGSVIVVGEEKFRLG